MKFFGVVVVYVVIVDVGFVVVVVLDVFFDVFSIKC